METTSAAAIKHNAGRDAAPQPKKKSGAGKAAAVFFVLALLAGVVVFCVLVVTNNLFGGRDQILMFLQSLDPEYPSLEEREQSVQTLRQELEKLGVDLEEKKATLDVRTAELDARQTLMDNKGETRTAKTLRLLVDGVPKEKLAELQHVGNICSAMTAQAAAATLEELKETFDMALVLYFMKPDKAAEALSEMEDRLAAGVLERMLG